MLWGDGVGASDQSPIPSEIRQWLIIFTMIAIHLPLLPGPARVALEHEMLAPYQATSRHCGHTLELSYRVQFEKKGNGVCPTMDHQQPRPNQQSTTRESLLESSIIVLIMMECC